MELVAQKRIFAVSLDSPNKHKAAAILAQTGQLMVTHCLPVSTKANGWRDRLREEIAEKANAGFVVILEDRSGKFSPYANAFSFDDIEDGRTMLQHAFGWWFSLRNAGNLILDDSITRYDMREQSEGSIIEIKNDDKGRVLYQPDWNKFQGAHKALLLCVIAAMCQPLSKTWMEAMLGCFPEPQEPECKPWERMQKAMNKWYFNTMEAAEARRTRRELEIQESRNGRQN